MSSDISRLCVVMFNEISLIYNIFYNINVASADDIYCDKICFKKIMSDDYYCY